MNKILIFAIVVTIPAMALNLKQNLALLQQETAKGSCMREWCDARPAPWEQKCTWEPTCKGCSVCAETCPQWCTEHNLSWEVKLGWEECGPCRGKTGTPHISPEYEDAEHPEFVNVAAAAEGSSKRTAVLLVGLMRSWDKQGWHKNVRDKILAPHDADLFIHTYQEPNQDDLPAMKEFFGDSLVVTLDESAPENPPQSHADYQFWHLQRAWTSMEKYETENNIKYDVVIKLRTDIAPIGDAYLSLQGWETPGRIHMLSDMIFWGQRDDMEKIVFFYDNIKPYYHDKFADPFKRPIDVNAMYESIARDPICIKKKSNPTLRNLDVGIDWRRMNKIQTLPYPDMGEFGALANLKAAKEAGFTVCHGNEKCPLRCGDHYFSEHRGPKSCEGAGDYTYGEIRCEKDILDWVMVHGLIICDVGASMHTIYWKTEREKRPLARDCD